MSLTHRHTLKMNGNCQFQDDCVFFDKISLSNDWFDMRKTWKSSLVLTFGGIVATKKILNIIWFFILHSLLLIAHLQHTEHSRTLQLLYQSIILMENKSKSDKILHSDFVSGIWIWILEEVQCHLLHKISMEKLKNNTMEHYKF